MLDQDLSGFGQRDTSSGPIQQGDSGFALECAQLLRHRRRRVREAFGHRGDRPEMCEISEQTQSTNIEHQAILR